MAFVLLGYTLAIWAIGLLGVLAPLVMASYNRMALALCNSAAAGVMLGAGMHLLHDAATSLLGLSNRWGSFPVAEFTCGLAFILVFYVETLFALPVGPGEHHLLVDHIQVDRNAECFPPRGWEWQDEECNASGSGSGGRGEGNPAEGPVPHRHDEHAHAHGAYGATDSSSGHSHGHDHSHNGAAGKHGLLAHMHHTRVHHPPSPDKRHQHQHQEQQEQPSSLYHSLSSKGTPSARGRESPNPSPAQSLLDKQRERHQHGHAHDHKHEHEHDDHDHIHSLAGALCLLAALGFHSIIEGLGLATASYHDGDHGGRDSTQLGVFLAILAHKGLAGITLGSTMLLASVNQTQFLLTALVFSAATPFGVGVGALISSYCKSNIAIGLMAAVAAGTFIHVSAIEIIPSAFKDSSATQFAKLLSLTVGFLAMMALSLVTSVGRAS